MQLSLRKNPAKVAETIFNILYLFVAAALGALLLLSGSHVKVYAGIGAAVLVVGDFFHLIPRIFAMWWGQDGRCAAAVGFGKFATSITMTLFYLLLWRAGTVFYGLISGFWVFLGVVVAVMAIIRIAVCCLPQNKWQDSGFNRFALYRNLPFAAVGLCVAVMFFVGAQSVYSSLSLMWLLILFSFAFYLPVVAFSHKNAKIGMLMLPKSCMYLGILLLFLGV